MDMALNRLELWFAFGAVIIIMFIIAAFSFATSRGDATKVGEARNFVIYGVVGVVVALIAFSLPFVVRNLLNSSGVGV